MRGFSRAFILLTVTAAAVACSTAGSGAPSARPDQAIITLREIEATEAANAFEIIQQLRPRWMTRNRGQRSIFEDQSDFARVMVDDFPPREWDHLREISRESVQEIRFLEPREATFLYGTGYNAGLVRVTTKR